MRQLVLRQASHERITLQSFWDGLLGEEGKPQSHLDHAIMIEHNHPRKSLKELENAKTSKEWSTRHFDDPYGII
jgi:hypothetical protein